MWTIDAWKVDTFSISILPNQTFDLLNIKYNTFSIICLNFLHHILHTKLRRDLRNIVHCSISFHPHNFLLVSSIIQWSMKSGYPSSTQGGFESNLLPNSLLLLDIANTPFILRKMFNFRTCGIRQACSFLKKYNIHIQINLKY